MGASLNEEQAINREPLARALATHRRLYPDLRVPATSGTRALALPLRSSTGRLEVQRPEADRSGGEQQ